MIACLSVLTFAGYALVTLVFLFCAALIAAVYRAINRERPAVLDDPAMQPLHFTVNVPPPDPNERLAEMMFGDTNEPLKRQT